MSAFGCWRLEKRGFWTPSRLAQLLSLLSSVYCRSGMSESSSSRTIFCEVSARGELVVTSMPGLGKRQHDGASVRSPLISTTQARQLPSERWLPPWQRCGMTTPCFFAVVMIGSSGRPTTVWPLSLNSIGIIASWLSLTRSISCLSGHFPLEVFHHAQHRVGRRLAQAADRGVDHHL